MPNLDEKIAEWRRQLAVAGVKTPEVLDELESHLREEIGALLSAGVPEAQAFQLAMSRIGSPAPLRTEFNKLKSKPCKPVAIGSWLWVGAIIVLAMLLSWNLLTERGSLLLYGHIFSLTAGYGAALLAGSFGICYVCYRSFHALSPVRQQSLGRAVLLFSRLAVGLVVVGVILGMLWGRQHFGGWLRGGVREAGSLCVSVWLIALWAIQRIGQVSDHAAMLMCICGNVIVSLAWFGAGIIASSPRMHGYGIGSHWPLAVFIGVHFVFLILGGMRISSLRLKSP